MTINYLLQFQCFFPISDPEQRQQRRLDQHRERQQLRKGRQRRNP